MGHYFLDILYHIKWVTTVCPESSDPFYIVTCYIKWVTTSWTYSKLPCNITIIGNGHVVKINLICYNATLYALQGVLILCMQTSFFHQTRRVKPYKQ